MENLKLAEILFIEDNPGDALLTQEALNEEKIKNIPVFVRTISKAEVNISKSYNSHANCCLIKPIDLNQFFDMVRSIEDFWLAIVKLPAS